jgi:hypothetical protein
MNTSKSACLFCRRCFPSITNTNTNTNTNTTTCQQSIHQLPRVLAQLTDPSKPTDLDGTGSGKVLGALLMTKHGALLGSSGFERAALLQQQAAVQAKLAEERAEAEAEASAVGSAAAGASSSSSSSSNSSSSPGSGPGSNELPSAKIIGAIVANVWGEYAGGIARGAQVDFDDHQGGDAASSSSLSQGRFGNEVGTFGEGELQVLLLELEYGQIAVVSDKRERGRESERTTATITGINEHLTDHLSSPNE